jgi:hypothetical protein
MRPEPLDVTVVCATNRSTKAREYRVVVLLDGEYRDVAGPFGIKLEAEECARGWRTISRWRA